MLPATDGKVIVNSFKFQYGATNILKNMLKKKHNERFKFQYGATNIRLIIT